MKSFDELVEVVRRLRAEDGCPWDREQTHGSLKAPVIEEAAEVICGINLYEQTGNPDNLQEELGDLLLQVLMQAQIAEEEGIFTLDDVINGIRQKMIRRHPHVFGNEKVKDSGEVLVNWEQIKKQEKAGKADVGSWLADAFDEAEHLIDTARKRKRRSMMTTVYCYSRCSTCKKALRWLDENQIAYTVIDIKEDHPDEETLRKLHAKSGLPLRKFFNTSGQLYRAMELSRKLPDMGEDEMFRLLSSDGMLVKRPLLITGDKVLAGFKEDDWKEALLQK